MILIKLAKNKNKTIKEAYGKYYARPVVTETIGIDELAEHMASHNTPFSKGAIKGLLTDMVSCVKELVLQNKAVKIDNLAIFSIGIINKMGAASIKEWSLAKFVEGYRLRARATGKLSNTQLSLDANAKNAMDLLNSSESAAGDNTTGDTTQGGGTTEGGGTSQGGTSQGGDYTEEYQCVYHEHMAKMIEERPYLWATHVWNLFDFAADGRDEGGKHGENQKGLVTMDRRIKKDAFYVYKAYWSKDAFVHLCGSRYTDRAEDVTEIKVYSNQKKVTLFVDGAEQETKEGARIFRFRVPITGTHTIRAVSGDCTDEITVRKVDAPNPDYIFNKQGDVVNWFDKEDFKADHYSISDTLGELAKNEMANAIVQRLMAQASASRGDVAESVKDNPALQRMMQRMTLASLLKQAGDAVSEEQMRALNDALQKIPKN